MKGLVLAMALMTTATAWGQDFSFGTPEFRGTGCKRGTTSTVTSPDGKALSILFDDFAVEVPQVDGDNDNDEIEDGLNNRRMGRFNENIDHKRCAMIIKTDVPQEEIIESISVKLDMRGSAFIDPGANVVFQSRLVNWKGRQARFRGGKAGQMIEKKMWNANNFQEEWVVSKTITIPINTGCHARARNNVEFSINNALIARLNPRRGGEGYAFSTIDSHDLGGRMEFKVKTRPCGSRVRTVAPGGSGRVRVSDNSRDPNDRNHGETRSDRDARRRQAQGNNRGRGQRDPRDRRGRR